MRIELARIVLVGLAGILFVVTAKGGEERSAGSLREGFREPPREARPSAYWLWINGYVNRDYMETELTQLRDAGVRGLCLFDMGARGGNAAARPPVGPAFLGDESVANIAHAVRVAGRLGMNVQLSVSSSWDMGGSWVEPRHASKGLYSVEVPVSGPRTFDDVLPMPALPAASPRGPDGSPVFLQKVAVLAIPANERAEGHDFVFALEPPESHKLTRAEFHNAAGANLPGSPARQVAIAVSETESDADAFREIWRGELEAVGTAQRFDLPAVSARFVRLRILSGHDPAADRVALGEFAVYSDAGVNVVASHAAIRVRDGAQLLGRPRALGTDGAWTAENIHDGAVEGPAGSWCSPGPPAVRIPNTAAVVDLTDKLGADGRLRWEVPPGNWVVLRYVCANTGERLKVPSPASNGLATDHLSAEATRAYLEHVIARLRSGLGEDLRASALSHLYLASYEVRGPIWTPDLPEQFRQLRGYDLLRYLPTLSGHEIGPDETTRQFLYDYQKTLGQLLVDAYYRTAREVAHEAGLKVESEAGGPGPPIHQVPVDALEALGAVDSVRGEFWPHRQEADQLWVVKETACAAHIYGKRRVHMEAFTSTDHWQDGPFDLKPSADRAFAEGMNHVVWHTASHQPPEAGRPGWAYNAGTHLGPNLIWWRQAPAFLDYLARTSYLLQRGTFVADVCVYYGDQGANFVPPKHIDSAIGYGYDYDVVNAEVILSRMQVKNGRLVVPDGPSYALLVLPERREIDPAVLARLESLVREGATVVGPRPLRASGLSVDPSRDEEVQRLSETLWGDCDGRTISEHAHGKGRVVWGKSPRELMLARGIVPDVRLRDVREDAEIDFLHRWDAEADAEIYFIRNTTERAESFLATFRVLGRVPERWDARTGEVSAISTYVVEPDGITVPLWLPPYGATFVVFRPRGDSPDPIVLRPIGEVEREQAPTVEVVSWGGEEGRLAFSATGRCLVSATDGREAEVSATLPAPRELAGAWDVAFPGASGLPATVRFDRLVSWTDRDEEPIRFYSGQAVYTREFEIPADWLGADRGVRLDLGNLWAVCEVKLNDQALGVLWAPPYRVDITESARPGTNRLEIVVANTWSNRLVGDAKGDPAVATTRTNITETGGVPWRDVPPRRSGLFGPVRLLPVLEKEMWP